MYVSVTKVAVYPGMYLGRGVDRGDVWTLGCVWTGAGGVDRGMYTPQHTHPGTQPSSLHITRDGHQSGRYASYWNAYLLGYKFVQKTP